MGIYFGNQHEKKILTVSVIVLTSYFAFATPSYYWAAVETTGYNKATESGADDVGKYSAYYCTVEAANTLFGGTSVSAIESYLQNNFTTVKEMSLMTFDSVAYSDGEYHTLDYVDTAFAAGDYVAIAFYGNEAYRVYGYESGVGDSAEVTPNGQLVFNETHAANESVVGGWQQAVSEPTSGLLMLLGLAGLALRRHGCC